MNKTKKNFYTVKEVYDIVFGGSLSKTTIHQLIKTGKIPAVEFMTKKLIPAYWVDECLSKANSKPEAATGATP